MNKIEYMRMMVATETWNFVKDKKINGQTGLHGVMPNKLEVIKTELLGGNIWVPLKQ